MSFSADITRWVQKTGANANAVFRAIPLMVIRECILISPVKTGRFRANWRVGVNRVDLTDSGPVPPGVAQPIPPTIASEQSKLLRAKYGDTVYVTNNVPYAGELNIGTSPQAPIGIFRVVIPRVQAQLKALARTK